MERRPHDMPSLVFLDPRWGAVIPARRVSVVMIAVVASCGRTCGTLPNVPRTLGEIRVDGELSEVDWRLAFRSGPFVDAATGQEQRPYSEARFVRDDRLLYVALYAADENILSEQDAFHVTSGAYAIDIGPDAKVTPVAETSTRGLACAVDLDGTLDDADDDDEEWTAELAIPMSVVSLREMELSRCDTPKSGARRCGVFSFVPR